ncbi:MAG: hypothetical protein ABR968_02060 [Bacteroidales bacterium]|jgi:DNA/RNA endonuclease YhcR with UshA esterase domain
MKKIIFLLFVLSFSYRGIAQLKIRPDDAKYHIGEKIIVVGKVEQINHSAKATFLNMGGKYPDNTFVGVIFNSDKGSFKDIDSNTGKEVELSGIIKKYKGKLEIILNDPTQIKVLRFNRVRYHKYVPRLKQPGN